MRNISKFFSETAHNPETNQSLRSSMPMPTANAIKLSSAIPVSLRTTASCQRTELCSYPTTNNSIIANNDENVIYHQVVVPANSTNNNATSIETTMKPTAVFNNQQKIQTFTSSSSSQPSISKNQEIIKEAIMSRLRHQIEQKEEFLRRPNGHPTAYNKPLISSHYQQQYNKRLSHESEPFMLSLESDYGRSLTAAQQHSPSFQDELREIQSNRLALREQFFSQQNSLPPNIDNYRLPPNSSSFLMQDYSKNSQSSNNVLHVEAEVQLRSSKGIPSVLQRTKQFETGHVLPPDGIDRTSLYKSELSRMSTKASTSSVALRCQAIESRLKPKISSKCLSEETMKDDEIKLDDEMIRSVSMEPIKECDKSPDQMLSSMIERERPRPVRENSYLTAVHTTNHSFMRQKSPKKTPYGDENDRKTRRSSYLKATTDVGDEETSPIAQQTDELNATTSSLVLKK